MSKLTTEQYLLLSKVAYSNFSNAIKMSRSERTLKHLSTLDTNHQSLESANSNKKSLLKDYIDGDLSKPNIIYKTGALQSLQSWRLVDFEQKVGFNWRAASKAAPVGISDSIAAGIREGGTGFSGSTFAEYDGDEVKNLVISFRGTEPNPLDPIDLFEDAGFVSGLSLRQYGDAYDFMLRSVRNAFAGGREMSDYEARQLFVTHADKITFTGHSLGGGLAQYATYMTRRWGAGEGIYAETFNGVGAGQTFEVHPYDALIETVRRQVDLRGPAYDYLDDPYHYDWATYNVIDHVNGGDTVGNHGTQLGETIHHIDDGNVDFTYIDFATLDKLLDNDLLYLQDRITATEYSQRHKTITDNLAAQGDARVEHHTLALYRGQSVRQNNNPAFTEFHGLDNFVNTFNNTMTAIYNDGTGSLSLNELKDKMTGEFSKYVSAVLYLSMLERSGKYDMATDTLDMQKTGDLPFLANNDYALIRAKIDYERAVIARYSRHLQKNSLENLYDRYLAVSGSNLTDSYVVFDLNNDAVDRRIERSRGAFFDHNGDGVRDQTEWVDPQDGLLAWDQNNNGVIDGVHELVRGSKEHGYNPWVSLNAIADNSLILKQTDAFSRLRLWIDANSNAKIDNNEITSLDKLGVTSVLTLQNFLHPSSAMHKDVGWSQYVRNNERNTAYTARFWYSTLYTDVAESRDYSKVDMTDIPNIAGAGRVASLHAFLQTDSQSAQLMRQIADGTLELDDARDAFASVVEKWAAPTVTDANWRGGARARINVLESFFGKNYTHTLMQEYQSDSGDTSYRETTIARDYGKLMEIYDDLIGLLYTQFSRQSRTKEAISQYDADPDGFYDYIMGKQDGTVAQSPALLDEMYFIDQYHSKFLVLNLDSFIPLFGQHKAYVSENMNNDTWYVNRLNEGESGILPEYYKKHALIVNDGPAATLVGGWFSDILHGGDFDDTLKGNEDQDTLIGGKGNDILEGNRGNDIYIYRPGDGHDVITERSRGYSAEKDFLSLKDYSKNDVTIRRAQNDLIVALDDGGTITVKDHFVKYQASLVEFHENGNSIEEIIFKDGSYDKAMIAHLAEYIYGTSSDDNLHGVSNQYNRIYGQDGNDTLTLSQTYGHLYGGDGDDTLDARFASKTSTSILEGGRGDDLMLGGVRDDLYIYSKGDGHDIIRDNGQDSDATDVLALRDIARSNILFERIEDSVMIRILTGGSVLLDKFFASGGFFNLNRTTYQIERINITEDGTFYTNQDIARFVNNKYGTDGSDTLVANTSSGGVLYGGEGDDVLYAGGESIAYGGSGRDELHNIGSSSSMLVGGHDDDRYVVTDGVANIVYARGDGHDTLQLSSYARAVIRFAEGISAQDVKINATPRSPYHSEVTIVVDGQNALTTTVVRQRAFPNIQLLFDDDTVANTATIEASFNESMSQLYTPQSLDVSTIQPKTSQLATTPTTMASARVDQLVQAMASFRDDGSMAQLSDFANGSVSGFDTSNMWML